ncbi:PAAR domain-containing protein [Pseudomonas sp. QL9]|uniref:PAAR domain-containing protein n=1 Tax=Pseudomonas TaxID=286 RepID=UPI0013635AE2|nr:PAAR domain-containing protein [Pseudomonas knackmussii]
MKGVIRIGDKTTGGGTVLAGSTEMIFDGIGAARLGDPVLCPLPFHGPTVIAEGDPDFCDDGIPVAFHGHRCACGCLLLTSLPDVSSS